MQRELDKMGEIINRIGEIIEEQKTIIREMDKALTGEESHGDTD